MKTLMKEIQPKLEEEGFAVFYKEASQDHTVDQLIIPVAKEDGSALNIEVNVLVDKESIYPLTHLIQIFMTMATPIPKEKLIDLQSLLTNLNQEIALGAFHLHESGIVYFKYTLLWDKEKQDTLLHPLIDALDISNHIFQTIEPHIINFLDS